tara:strand:- start:13253 stop:13384 length:132 start_codon:yes stop_codon:yes gene_type:complete
MAASIIALTGAGSTALAGVEMLAAMMIATAEAVLDIENLAYSN